MNILVVYSVSSGVLLHRQITPHHAWNRAFPQDFVVPLNDTRGVLGMLEKYDFDIIQFSLAPIFYRQDFQKIVDIIKKKKIAVITDIDDLYEGRHDIEVAIKNSDAITTPNRHLKRHYSLRGAKRVYIVENGVDPEHPQWKPYPRVEDDRVVFGYLGSTRHEKDLKFMKYDFKDEFLYTTVASYSSILDVDFHSELRPMHEYAMEYDNIDVSLRPLAPNRFNYGKSVLGIIEAGFKKKAVMVTDDYPYKDLKEPLDGIVDFVPPGQSWKEWVKDYPKDEALEKGEDLYEYVSQHYHIDVLNQKRREVYEEVIKTKRK